MSTTAAEPKGRKARARKAQAESASREQGETPAEDLQREVKRVSARMAIQQVLKRASEPLKTAEIAKRVLSAKGVKLAGKTPEATIAAILAVENKKPDGLFVRVDKGTYDLRERIGEAKEGEETKEVAA